MSVPLNHLLTLAGRLDDNPGFDTPREGFRRFLLQHVTDAHIARALIEQCQHALGEQHHRALQDLVVFIGRLLGFETTFGLYQPAAGAPEEYGRWLSRRRLDMVLEIRTDQKSTDLEDLARTVAALTPALTSAAEPARCARALGLCVLTPPYASRDRFEEAVTAQKPHADIRIVSLRSLLLLADMMGAGRLKHDDVVRMLGSIPAPDFVVELLEQFARAPAVGDASFIIADTPHPPEAPEAMPAEASADANTELRRRHPPKTTAVLVFSAHQELRAAASNQIITLGIAEVGDKNMPAASVHAAASRAVAELSRADATTEGELKSPEDLSHEYLHSIARTFHVPIAYLSVDLRQYRCSVAHVSVKEPLSGVSVVPHQWAMLQQVITSREPLVIPDVAEFAGTSSFIPPAPVRGFIAVPMITSGGRLLGALSLLDVKPLSLGPEQIDKLMDAVRPMADEFERRYLSEPEPAGGSTIPRTDEDWAALERLALTDSVTGLYNRHAGEQAIVREAARGRRIGSRLCVALFDLDTFKQVNDVHGHDAGDRVLSEVGRILKTSFRASDLAVRWGGDEFLVLLPDVALAGAVAFAERARIQVEALSFPGIERVTLSAGVVEIDRNEDPSVALKRADASLYDAKARGRNRVTSSDQHQDPGTIPEPSTKDPPPATPRPTPTRKPR